MLANKQMQRTGLQLAADAMRQVRDEFQEIDCLSLFFALSPKITNRSASNEYSGS